MRRVERVARRAGLAIHLDGARLWNASVASGVDVADFAACADTVSVCFSKGLGAPVGSALCGPSELISRAIRHRRMLGGAMRQAGILAAGALYALDHNLARLREDHEKARVFAEAMSGTSGVEVDLERVETNVVNVRLVSADADRVIAACKQRGVLIGTIAPQTLRAVFHLDVPVEAAPMSAALCREAVSAATPR
jgi:threonine aldolase